MGYLALSRNRRTERVGYAYWTLLALVRASS